MNEWDIKLMRQTLEESLSAMRLARARIERLTKALEAIHERAQDNYDGPEDSTHGPYLSLAQEGLGIHP